MRKEIGISTSRSIQLEEITSEVQQVVAASGVEEGYCIVFCPHTTAGLIINEHADPDVARDLERAFQATVPEVRFDHLEGNSPSHFLTSITGSSVHILVEGSRLRLGTWQGIFFCEFDGPRQRRIWVQVGK